MHVPHFLGIAREQDQQVRACLLKRFTTPQSVVNTSISNGVASNPACSARIAICGLKTTGPRTTSPPAICDFSEFMHLPRRRDRSNAEFQNPLYVRILLE